MTVARSAWRHDGGNGRCRVETATKLALFIAGVVVAVVAGWAVGQATAVLNPNYIVPGRQPLDGGHGHALPAPAAVLPPTTFQEY
jgi:hypothetical protein